MVAIDMRSLMQLSGRRESETREFYCGGRLSRDRQRALCTWADAAEYVAHTSQPVSVFIPIVLLYTTGILRILSSMRYFVFLCDAAVKAYPLCEIT